MKYHLQSLRAAFLSVILLILCSTLLVSWDQVINARAQDPETSSLTLVVRNNGFDGLYLSEGKTYKIENWVEKEMFRTCVIRPDGAVLINVSKESDVLHISLPTGKLEMDTSNPRAFSAEETGAIRQFTQTNDCALVKKIVIEIFKKRAAEKPSLLGGFAVISMLLGE